MKARIIVTSLLLAFVAVSVVFFVVKEKRRGAAPENAVVEPPPATAAGGVVVYYFHATRRCARCIKFEEYTHEALTTGFADDLKAGTLVWRMVNVDEPGNERYVTDYNLTTKAVILVDASDGARWKNLERIWDLVGDKPVFITYIQDEVKYFRKGR